MGRLHVVLLVVCLGSLQAAILKPKQRTCGVSPVYERYIKNLERKEKDESVQYVVGGQETVPPGKWPWMANLNLLDFLRCGGTLIAPEWIISAAHCFPRFDQTIENKWKVRLGVHNISDLTDVVQTIEIEKVYRYPDYNASIDQSFHDIALIKLAKPVAKLGDYVQPLCLPPSWYRKAKLIGKKCVVTGWGKTANEVNATARSEVLNEVDVRILRDNKCKNYKPVYKTGHQICAGTKTGGKDACREDSGGPMACMLDGRWRLIGIVSYGQYRKCGDPDYPGVYTSLLHKPFQRWIRKTTRGQHYNARGCMSDDTDDSAGSSKLSNDHSD